MARKISRRRIDQIRRDEVGVAAPIPVGETVSGPWTVTDALGNQHGPYKRSELLRGVSDLSVHPDWIATDGDLSLPVRQMLLRPDPAQVGPAPPQVFSAADELSPAYCPGCRRPVPTAEAVAHGGYCSGCANWLAAAQQAREQLADAVRRAIEAERLQREAEAPRSYAVDTGMGRCPACGSTNTAHIRATESDTGAQLAFGCCMISCIAWPLALLAPFLFRQRITCGKCNVCGQQWPL